MECLGLLSNTPLQVIAEWSLILVLLAGIRWFREPRAARRSNLAIGIGLVVGVVLVTWQAGLTRYPIVALALVVGTALGVVVSQKVNMLGIPSLIALQNGTGGLAAAVVSLIEMAGPSTQPTPLGSLPAIVALTVGTVTFSGSLVACGRLSGILAAKPTRRRGHYPLLSSVLTIGVVTMVVGILAPSAASGLVLACAGMGAGILASIRVGGADMPVLISALNTTSGLAGAFTGIVMHSNLLIACGAAVASSGFVLTAAMCRAMNRRMLAVLIGHMPGTAKDHGSEPVEQGPSQPAALSREQVLSRAAATLRQAQRIIIVPGYGMALAQAQSEVANLARRLESMGHEVTFAIHPVAGRMPGHMYVLLAEAGVDYSKMLDIDSVNDHFRTADVAFVVGACDVVNPAATGKEGTPISGMPILMAHQAKTVIVCNLDMRPGYSGVENPLYTMANTLLLLGDAKATVEALRNLFSETSEVV